MGRVLLPDILKHHFSPPRDLMQYVTAHWAPTAALPIILPGKKHKCVVLMVEGICISNGFQLPLNLTLLGQASRSIFV